MWLIPRIGPWCFVYVWNNSSSTLAAFPHQHANFFPKYQFFILKETGPESCKTLKHSWQKATAHLTCLIKTYLARCFRADSCPVFILPPSWLAFPSASNSVPSRGFGLNEPLAATLVPFSEPPGDCDFLEAIL